MDLSGFNHKTTVHVRFHEVDMLGVCNNAVYINYLEDARLKYIKAIGMMPKEGIFSDGKIYFIVRNEINYRGHAFFDDELNIYTRVEYIKNSSFGFEHLVVNTRTGEVIADGKGVIANVDPETKKSSPLSDKFVNTVLAFDKDVQLLRDIS
ncbi:MAG: acyl-CoA thioesterase [Syntrophothermus sp.]